MYQSTPYAIWLLILSTLAFSLLSLSCKKDYLSKDQEKALFAEPNTAELDYIFKEWQARDLVPTAYTVIQQETILSGKFTFKMVSFKVNGIKEYAALLIPITTAKVPVQILVGGFGLGMTTNSRSMVLDSNNGSAPHIVAIPALRGQSLEIGINGTVYKSPISEGDQCEAFDGGTDDVLALLNLIEQTEPLADVNRTGVQGGSRGGAVAFLAGIRDTRIKRVIGVVSPTNMLELTAKMQNDPTYQCQFLSSFKNGQTSLAQTRNKMLASSPIYFARYLPLAQLHMGLKDQNVPIKQGNDLKQKIEALGNASKFELFTYDKTHADIAVDNTELSKRQAAFFSLL